MGVPHAAPQPLPPPDVETRAVLSDRELLVLQLLWRGYPLGQCAQLVGVTGTEALAVAQSAARKLGVPDGTAAAFEAYRLGLVV